MYTLWHRKIIVIDLVKLTEEILRVLNGFFFTFKAFYDYDFQDITNCVRNCTMAETAQCYCNHCDVYNLYQAKMDYLSRSKGKDCIGTIFSAVSHAVMSSIA